mmetsp:Transcript_11521/g.23441  ORF Transcript_11521/g.23441 Transcript_11521/m.23441 type:complete len:117 (-) Transcript_11521:304-654(-)
MLPRSPPKNYSVLLLIVLRTTQAWLRGRFLDGIFANHTSSFLRNDGGQCAPASASHTTLSFHIPLRLPKTWERLWRRIGTGREIISNEECGSPGANGMKNRPAEFGILIRPSVSFD